MGPTENGAEMRCIVFADMVSSTPPVVEARRHGREREHVAASQRCLDLWREHLHPFGLQLFKRTGDGFLATFADPLFGVRAIIHALEAAEQEPCLRAFPMRVGVHVGVAYVQPDGDVDSADVNLAHAVMSRAEGGQMLLSEACAGQVSPYVDSYQPHAVGKVTLKGFDRPVRLFQLCGPQLPGPVRRRWALPKGELHGSLDHFVGRKRELAWLARALRDDRQRGVSLVGPAGAGKTRVARELAHMIQTEFADGIYFVELEEATDTGGVLARVAAALSIPLSMHADPHEALRVALAELDALLILDNFEQVLDAAPAVAGLLLSLPRLRVLVTSRDRLGYRGERVFDLEPLAVPVAGASFAAIRATESVALFADRAKSANARFKLTPENAADVAELCRTLEGIPLLLEIAAAELRYRPLARMRDIRAEILDMRGPTVGVPERHRTVRALLDWSYYRQSEADRLLLEQLSIFETPFGDDDVFEVCTGADLEAGLRRLRDRGLVCCPHADGERPHRLLVPIREYARERLGRPAGALRERFIVSFTRRGLNLHDQWRGGAEAQATEGVREDLENFRAAWNMACEDSRTEAIGDLGFALTAFAPILPSAAGIEPWLDETERALRRLGDACRLGQLYNRRARLASRRGACAEAVALQAQCLEHLAQAGTPEQIADAHGGLAWFALRAGQGAVAERHAALAIVLARECRQQEVQAVGHVVLARIQTERDTAAARSNAEQARQLFEGQANYRGMSHASLALARIAESEREYGAARSHYHDALTLCASEGDEVQIVHCLDAISAFEARHGDCALASEARAALAPHRIRLGMPTPNDGARAWRSETGPAVLLPVIVERILTASLRQAA